MSVLSFEEVFKDESGGNIKTLKTEFLESGKIPIVDQGKGLIAGYTNDENRICKSQLPVIIFGDHTRCFKFVNFSFAMGADGVKVLKPKIQADEKFLYYYLKALHLPDAGYDRHFKYLKRTEIFLPPLDEQKRIAEVLDKADALREKRRLALNKLDQLLQSVFLEMFGDPVKNPKGWSSLELKAISKVTTGSTPPSELPNMFGGEIPFVTPGDLEKYNEKINRTLTIEGSKRSRIVRTGSTLVCCIGATIGKVGKAKMPSAFNQQINAIEWFTNVNDDYGFYVLRFYKSIIATLGASTTLPILKKSSFEKMKFPVPPIELQNKFAEVVKKIESLKAKKQNALANVENLFQSLRQKAFQGELWK